MNVSSILSGVLVLMMVVFSSAEETREKKPVVKLQIGVKKRISPEDCDIKTKKGDKLNMLYVGTLYKDDSRFDSNENRDSPFSFTLGVGQVIQGWDRGLLGMCKGEKRKLVVPSDMGYGKNGAPPKIPADAALVFEVELLDIIRKDEL